MERCRNIRNIVKELKFFPAAINKDISEVNSTIYEHLMHECTPKRHEHNPISGCDSVDVNLNELS